MIEASHFDPAEAYAAVDRHRLDDREPYLYRTREQYALVAATLLAEYVLLVGTTSP